MTLGLAEGEARSHGLDCGKIEKSEEDGWDEVCKFGLGFENSDGSEGDEVGKGDGCGEEIAGLALEILKVEANEKDSCEEKEYEVENLERGRARKGLGVGLGFDFSVSHLAEEDNTSGDEKDSAVKGGGLIGSHIVKQEDVHVSKCADE